MRPDDNIEPPSYYESQIQPTYAEIPINNPIKLNYLDKSYYDTRVEYIVNKFDVRKDYADSLKYLHNTHICICKYNSMHR